MLNTGDAVYMPWLASVKSVLEMWYPGVAGGVATADVLTGDVNPSGKLPHHVPGRLGRAAALPDRRPRLRPGGDRDPEQQHGHRARTTATARSTPACSLSNPAQGQHTYRTVDMQANGIFQGYRWYDLHAKAPLFPFGHGLSYTQFAYSHLTS